MDGKHWTIRVREIPVEHYLLVLGECFDMKRCLIGGHWVPFGREMHRTPRLNPQQREPPRYPGLMTLVRLLLGIFLALLVMVFAVPGAVLVDLVSGGTGLGICPAGLGTCTTGVFAGAELLVLLSVIIALIAALIAASARLLRWLASRRQAASQ